MVDEETKTPAETLKTKNMANGHVWLLGAGPGDPDLITWRGVLLLGKAEVVLHDALSHPELLQLCPQAEIIDVGKRFGQRATPQEVITNKLIELASQGKVVVRLKGGDPFMFARGSEEALALADANISFDIVPGVTSAIAASAFAGIPLTHRDASSSVTFITGSDKRGKEWSPEAWKKLATATGTICIYMGIRRIEAIAQAVMDGGRSPDTPAAVVRWGARPQQETLVAPLKEIAQRVHEAGLRSPAIIIIGEVVELRKKLRWYDKRTLFAKRVLVARPAHQAAETCRALRERSAAPVVCPAIEILPSPSPDEFRHAVKNARLFDWVVFTSANGVRAFFREVEAAGLDARVFGAARIAVIGPKTAEALKTYGLRADLCARKFVAESLVLDLLDSKEQPQKLLLARAQEARDVLPETLAQAGVDVTVVAAYQTRIVSGEKAAILRKAVESQVDVVLLTSSSMVSSLVHALGDDALTLLAKKIVVCIGPITAKTAKDFGVLVHVEASIYTVEGALDALEEYLAN